MFLPSLDYNMRRGPVYEHVHHSRNIFSSSKTNSMSSLSTRYGRAGSSTEDVREELTQLSDIDNEIPLLMGSSKDCLNDEEDLTWYDHSCWFGAMTPSSLMSGFPSLETLQSVVELENGCNVVLQGRIGQVGLFNQIFFCFLLSVV